MSLDPTSNLRILHLFNGFVCASFCVFNPFFFFYRCCVKFIIGIVLERDLAVLIIVCMSFVRPAVFVCLIFSFLDLLVSSLRLHDESKHFALRRLNHSLVLICECPSSTGVVHRRGYHCVEKPKSMFKHASSRCQLLSILVERCPGSPDTISDFGRLLLLESYHLPRVFCTFFSCLYFDFDVINLNFFLMM